MEQNSNQTPNDNGDNDNNGPRRVFTETFVFTGTGPSLLTTMQNIMNRIVNGPPPQQQQEQQQQQQSAQQPQQADLQMPPNPNVEPPAASDPVLETYPDVGTYAPWRNPPPAMPDRSSTQHTTVEDVEDVDSQPSRQQPSPEHLHHQIPGLESDVDDPPLPRIPRAIRPLPRNGARPSPQPHAHFHAHTPTGTIDLFTFTVEADDAPHEPQPGGRPVFSFNIGSLGPDFFNAFEAAVFGAMDKEREPDIERAKILLRGMEIVPEGLVRRLERAGGVPGGQGTDESGSAAGCAVCWGPLLDEIDPGEWETALPSKEKEKTPGTDEKENDKAQEHDELQGCIVALPCAHVYHAQCLLPWFSRQTTCPTCRLDVDPDSLTWTPRPPRVPQRPPATTNQQAGSPNDQPDPPQTFNLNDMSGVVEMSTIIDLTPWIGPGNQTPRPRQQDMLPPEPLPVQPQQPNVPPSVPPPAQPQPPNMPPNIHPLAREVQFGPHRIVPLQQPNTLQSGPLPLPSQQPNAVPPVHLFPWNVQFGPHRVVPLEQPNPPPSGPLPPPPQRPNAPSPMQLPPWDGRYGLFGPQTPQQPTMPSSVPLPPQPQQAHMPTSVPEPPPEPYLAQLSSGEAPRFWEARLHAPRHFPFPSGNAPQTSGNTPLTPTTMPEPAPEPHVDPMPYEQVLRFPPQSPRLAPLPEHPPLPPGHPLLFMHHPHPMNPTQPAQFEFDPEWADGSPPHPPMADSPPMANTGTGPAFVTDEPAFFISREPPTHPNGHAPRPLRRERERERRKWTPPEPVGKTLRQRVEEKERELGLRCDDAVCGVAPTDEEPEGTGGGVQQQQQQQQQIRIHAAYDVQGKACAHTFHPACLVMSARVAGVGVEEEGRVEGGEVQVSCPACRAEGSLSGAEWEEGVRASEAEMA